ncbi:LYR motif-containing protein 4 [Actinomortierella ambigua]|nr:LYR motif-containing protein 4 [Actinomortierella ambigua]
MSSRTKVLSLYRDLLHCSSRFAAYNFRDYAIRRTQDAFRAAKNETDPARIEALIAQAEKELGVVKRQSVISQLYGSNKLVIESRGKKLAEIGSNTPIRNDSVNGPPTCKPDDGKAGNDAAPNKSADLSAALSRPSDKPNGPRDANF